MEIDDHRRVDGGIIQGAEHTSLVLNHKRRHSYIISGVCNLRKKLDDFDAIACCGISGVIVGVQIAELLNKEIIIVRKPQNNKLREYSEFTLEGVAPRRYVIVDDLVCSGRTINYILDEISSEYPRAFCVGMYSYMKESCAFRNAPEIFKKRFGIDYLNT